MKDALCHYHMSGNKRKSVKASSQERGLVIEIRELLRWPATAQGQCASSNHLLILLLGAEFPGGYSHIFMDTYDRCTWMGFETKMYVHGWVIFPKNREILVHGWVLKG